LLSRRELDLIRLPISVDPLPMPLLRPRRVPLRVSERKTIPPQGEAVTYGIWPIQGIKGKGPVVPPPPPPPQPTGSPILWEYCNTGDNGYYDLWGPNWISMTFTVVSAAHSITSVKMKGGRRGTPGTLTLSIRNTDVDGKPTGGDLTSGAVSANGWNFVPNTYAWYEISVTEYILSLNTKYAIVVRCPAGTDNNNEARWRFNGSNPYVDGGSVWSPDSGSTWNLASANDCMFEVWGRVLA